MFAQKFEDYYGEALTLSDENDCIFDPFAGKDLPHLPFHVTKEFMDMTIKATNRISLIPKKFCKYSLLGFRESNVFNSFEICDKKIDFFCDSLALRNCI